MILLLAATVSAGLFAGAALYINAVEHPARMSCGSELAVRVFAPSYRRAAIMQASLAVVGGLAGLLSSWRLRDSLLLIASVLLLAVVPFTLLVVALDKQAASRPGLGRALEAFRRFAHALGSSSRREKRTELLGLSSFSLADRGALRNGRDDAFAVTAYRRGTR